MGQLNQIIAVEKSVKTRVHESTSQFHKLIQKPALFEGLSRKYHPLDDADKEVLPSENKKVQFSIGDLLRAHNKSMTELFAITARKDWTNQHASADIKIGDTVLIKDVPVSYLLFLEKQVNDIRSSVAQIPELDNTETWLSDSISGLWKTEETKTHRGKKIQRPITLSEPTKEHPAQCAMITEDVIAGYWHQVKMSGAMPKTQKEIMLERVDTLLKAIKVARETANCIDEVACPDVGKAIFTYLMED